MFLVGQDPHDRISYDETSGCVKINPYIDPHAPIEIDAAAPSATPEVAEAEPSSSKVASSASSSTQLNLEDNIVEESKVAFMSTISRCIEILKAISTSQDDSASAGAPTYSSQDIDSANSRLLEFVTNDLYLDVQEYSDLIGQAKAVLPLE